ncbi:hypothetical protein OJAV_G00073400 [Oryzias javanicus]|uniref:C1q domain-containing protein n=1 Tax=Oryzias javanicus TaxID=123683 RepID=A0A437D2Y5_ORYJA|nr:hypothetical protein OJAV_G00073400 [Oryzias javanicus]
MSCLHVLGVLLCGVCLATGDSEPQIQRQTAGRPGSAVLFFVAHQGSLRNIRFNPIIFDHVLVNQGSGYNNNTGVFTVPHAGVYQFVFSAQLCRGPNDNNWYFLVNGNQRMKCHAQVSGGDTVLNTCYYMEDLKAGDRVWVKQEVGSCAWASTASRTITFSGILLAREGISMLGGALSPQSLCPLTTLKRSVTSSSAGQSVTPLTAVVVGLLCLLMLN